MLGRGRGRGQSPPTSPTCPPEPWQRNLPEPPAQQPQNPGRQPTDLNAVLRVALLLLLALLNAPCIHLQPVLTPGIPRHRRHCGVSLPSRGSGQWISPWALLSNTFSKVGETWRETHCQVQVRHACNHPPVSQAQKRASPSQKPTGELQPILFS